MYGPDLQLRPTGPQFGGEVVNYEKGLSFVTIHGSGHMVPQFRPQAALHMLGKVGGIVVK
jgi:serine carboxypeptidase-like clade I